MACTKFCSKHFIGVSVRAKVTFLSKCKGTFTHAWSGCRGRWADFDIPIPLPRACSHICRGMVKHIICHVYESRCRIGHAVSKRTRKNWVFDPFLAKQILLPFCGCVCVNTCNDLHWSQFSACFSPRLATSAPRMCGCTLITMENHCWFNVTLEVLNALRPHKNFE